MQGCRYHSIVFDVVDFTLGPCYHKGSTHAARCLPPLVSLTSPQGLLIWAGLAAHWTVRNSVKFHGVPPDWDFFLSKWSQTVALLINWTPLSGWVNTFYQFYHALCTLQQTGSLPSVPIPVCKVPDCRTTNEKKKQRKAARKEELAQQALATVAELESQGWVFVYTDGSAARHPKVGLVPGYGCSLVGEWEENGYLPADGVIFFFRCEMFFFRSAKI